MKEMFVRNRLSTFLPALIVLLFAMPCASPLNAQITNEIRAHIDHSFVIENTALPPGDYTFRMMQDSDLNVVTAMNDNDKTSVNFLVRAATNDRTPAHSEVIFRKYGNMEFLDKIFQGGSKLGSAVAETGREEARLVKLGQQPTLDREEQKHD